MSILTGLNDLQMHSRFKLVVKYVFLPYYADWNPLIDVKDREQSTECNRQQKYEHLEKRKYNSDSVFSWVR